MIFSKRLLVDYVCGLNTDFNLFTYLRPISSTVLIGSVKRVNTNTIPKSAHLKCEVIAVSR